MAMAKSKHPLRRRVLWWLVFILAIGMLTMFTLKFDNTQLGAKYSKPFESYSQDDQDGSSRANPFVPAGMHESGIKKYQGRRYQTY